MRHEQRTGKRILAAILLALCVWGLLLAVGAYLGLWHRAGEDGGLRDLRRFWIVLGIMALFLTFWLAALALRARRVQSRRPRDAPRPGRDD